MNKEANKQIANQTPFKTCVVIVGLCLIMAGIELWIAPSYFWRSVDKIILFILIPIALARRQGQRLHFLFTAKKQPQWLSTLIIAILIYCTLIALYILLADFLPLHTIQAAVERNVAVERHNFIAVALYIAFINAFIEEFFFRGVACLALQKPRAQIWVYVFSAAVFSLYHAPMLRGWSSLPIILLGLFALFIGGIFFACLNRTTGHIWRSYATHLSANLAINTLGLHMFGIIHLPFLAA